MQTRFHFQRRHCWGLRASIHTEHAQGDGARCRRRCARERIGYVSVWRGVVCAVRVPVSRPLRGRMNPRQRPHEVRLRGRAIPALCRSPGLSPARSASGGMQLPALGNRLPGSFGAWRIRAEADRTHNEALQTSPRGFGGGASLGERRGRRAGPARPGGDPGQRKSPGPRAGAPVRGFVEGAEATAGRIPAGTNPPPAWRPAARW